MSRYHEVVALALSPQVSVALRLDTTRIVIEGALAPPPLRAVWMARWLGGNTIDEIAERQGYSRRWAYVQLREAEEAVERVREELEHAWGTTLPGELLEAVETRRTRLSHQPPSHTRPIPGWCGAYHATEEGRVWSSSSGQWLTLQEREGAAGYYELWRGGGRVRMTRERVLAATWEDAEPEVYSDRELGEYIRWRYGEEHAGWLESTEEGGDG